MLIGYAYVSAHEQTMSLQQHALTAAGCRRIVADRDASADWITRANGTMPSRPGLEELLQFAHAHDTVVVWRLDRLADSLAHLSSTIRQLEEQHVGFRSLTEQIDTTMPGGQLIFHVFSALAEFERTQSVERTPLGLMAPHARGRYGGRPRLSVMQDPQKLAQARELYAERRVTVGEICRLLGVSRSTFYTYVPERTTRTVPNA